MVAASDGRDRSGERERMIADQLQGRGIRSVTVLDAMRRIPREQFVPDVCAGEAYADSALAIDCGQTISQPYMVARMTELLELRAHSRVLEIGTGSGYQAAILAEIVSEVYTIEIVPKLGESAQAKLKELGYDNVHVRIGDGYQGWPEHAPFDRVIVTAAPEKVPQPLIDQLKVGGRLVLPVGPAGEQYLEVLVKTESGVERYPNIPVRFVPMTGKAQELEP